MAPPTPNAIDLTTLANVASWLSPYTLDNGTQDQVIQDVITAFSAFVLRATGRGPMDGTIPATSPFKTPVSYSETYDGSGTYRQPIRNWPIVSVTSVTVDGVAVSQSTNVNTPGWVIDGDARFITIRGGYNGYVATFRNYGFQGLRGGGIAGIAPGGFAKGLQNVQIVYSAGYSAVPFDLEMCARKVSALTYKRRQWIGQRSQALAAGAGTVSYNDFEMDANDRNVLQYYKTFYQ